MKLYQTPSMELATVAMTERNRQSMIYSRYRTMRKIRFRWNQVPDVDIKIAMSWQPGCDAILADWARRGGCVEYRPHVNNFNSLPTPASDAMLLIEAPLQMPLYDKITAGVRQEVVVYRPPTWELHTETLAAVYPVKADYMALDAITQGLADREPDEVMAGCMGLVKFNKPVAFTAWDIEQLLGWSETRLRYAMLRFNKTHRGRRFSIYSTRIAPDDPDLREAYKILCAQPEVGKGNYVILVGGSTSRPQGPGFDRMLKRLIRECYVVKEDSIYIKDVGGKPMDYDLVDATNNVHRSRWLAVRDMIDNADEYFI